MNLLQQQNATHQKQVTDQALIIESQKVGRALSRYSVGHEIRIFVIKKIVYFGRT